MLNGVDRNCMIVKAVVLAFAVFLSIQSVSAVPNPAAVYCEKMGYEWVKRIDANGERGYCVFPDNSSCDAWQFYEGSCGDEWRKSVETGFESYEVKKVSSPELDLSSSGILSALSAVTINAFNDYAYDSNSDGKYDYLILDAQITASPGVYIVYSQLQLNGNVVAEAENVTYIGGTEWVRLRFSGNDVRNSLNTGSFTAVVGVFDPITYQNYDVEAHTTKSYNYAQFYVTSPTRFDWRNVNGVNYITPPKDQGQCGDCWSFAAIGAVEAKYKIVNGITLDLSEQELLSCCAYCGDCNGGDPVRALTYVEENGAVTEACFPYTATLTACTFCTNPQKYSILSYERVEDGSIAKRLIVDFGPVIASMYWSDTDSYWDNGVLRCSRDLANNHAVLVIGYDDSGGYWIVKNSWGTSWGDNGYFKLGYGECNLTFHAYVTRVPVLKHPPVANFTFTPSSPKVGEAVTFTSTSYDPDGSIVGYYWDFDGDGVADASGVTVTHVWNATGNYVVTHTVVDNDGLESSTSRIVNVSSSVPLKPVAVISYSPKQPVVNETVTFDASASYDPDGSIVGYYWDFDGDGVADASGVTVTHVWKMEGNYTVTLKVVDDDGLNDTKSVQIEVVKVRKGDMNGDGKVDFSDLIAVLNLLLNKKYDVAADMNGDGKVDFSDLIAVLNLLLKG